MATYVNRSVGWYEPHDAYREVKKGVCVQQFDDGSMLVREFGSRTAVKLSASDEIWILRNEN